MMRAECPSPWIDQLPEPDPTLNPFENLSACIQGVFEDLVNSPRVLLDQFVLPPDGGAVIAQAIKDGEALAVSDGSFDESRQAGSSAFIISPSQAADAVLLEGVNFVTGLPEEQTAYRSELAGVLGVLTSVDALVHFYGIDSGSITIALDGESALRESESGWPLRIDQKCFDYLQVVRSLLKKLPVTVTFRWVEGHQKEKGFKLDWWAAKNDLVDKNAKAFLKQCLLLNPVPYRQTCLLHEDWCLYLDGVKLADITRNKLYQAFFGPRTLAYWENYHDIPIPTYCDIDWKASKAAAKKLPMGLRRWRAKFSCGWIGVGSQLVHYQHQDHSNCPLCGVDDEKVSHVLHCPDPEAVSFATDRVKSILVAKLTQEKTEETLGAAIVHIFCRLRRNLPIRAGSYCSTFRPTIMAQQAIGWDNWLLGRWSPRWQHIQAAHYLSIGSRRSPRRWTSSIIHQFFLLCWDFWQSRNDRLHGSAGIQARTQHASLDESIEDELNQGPEGLTVTTRHFLHIPLVSLKRYSISHKEQWLASVRIGRRDFAAHLQPAAPFQQEVDFLRAWLNLDVPS